MQAARFILPQQARNRHGRPQRTPKRKQPVTIIVSLVCNGAIVVASDSQTSFWPGTSKLTDTDKISVLAFEGGDALIAQSGNADLSSRAVEILTEISKGSAIDSERTIANFAEIAVKRVRDQLREYHSGDCASSDDYKRLFEDHEFALLIAHYHKETPCVYVISFHHGMAIRQMRPCVTAGCGAPVAEMALKGIFSPAADPIFGVLTAVYAVEKTKEFDMACGGPTKCKYILASDKRSQGDFDSRAGGAIAFLLKQKELNADTWQKQLRDVIESASEQWKAEEAKRDNRPTY